MIDIADISSPGPYREKAEAFLQAFRVETLVLSATHSSISPDGRWAASSFCSSVSLNPVVAMQATEICMSPRREAEEVLRIDWNADDPQNEHQRTRLDRIAGELWGEVLWVVAQEPGFVKTVNVVAGVLGSTLSPFTPLAVLVNPESPRAVHDTLVAKLGLEVNLKPGSRITRPSPLLVPTIDRAEETGFLHEGDEPAITYPFNLEHHPKVYSLFAEAELVLAEAVVVALNAHSMRSRADEETTLMNRTTSG